MSAYAARRQRQSAKCERKRQFPVFCDQLLSPLRDSELPEKVGERILLSGQGGGRNGARARISPYSFLRHSTGKHQMTASSTRVTVEVGDGTQMQAYVSRPDGHGPHPGIIVLQEAMGVN